MSLSIFFPCYNDSKTIKKLVEDSFIVAKSLTKDFEVLVIDDGSTDNSRQILKKLTHKYPKLVLIFHSKNLGYGGALRSGFSNATKELVFYTDGDGQYDVRELKILYSLMTDDVNFINGIKMNRQDPTYRIFIGNLYNFFVRWVFWLPIYDTDCDYRLIRKELLKKLDLKSNTGSICVELIKKAQRQKATFRQVSIHHYERAYGSSQFFRWDRILFTFKELITLWIYLMITQKFFKNGKIGI